MKFAFSKGLIAGLFNKYKSRPLLRLGLILFWAAGFILIAILAYDYKDELLTYLTKANYWHLAGFLFFYLLSFSFGGMAWASIIKAFSNNTAFWENLKIYAITLASRRLPGTIWYIGGRALYYQELKVSLFTISMASMVELVCWTVSGFLIGLFMIPSILNWQPVILNLLRLAAILGLFFFHPKFITWIMKRLGHPMEQSLKYRNTLLWVFLCACGWLAGSGMVIELSNAFTTTSFQDNLYMIGAWGIAGALGMLTFFLPSSFGVTEISLTSLLAVRLPLSLSFVISLLIRILAISIEFLLSVIFYFFKGRKAA